MKHYFVCLLLIVSGLSSSIGDVLNSEVSQILYSNPYGDDFKTFNGRTGRSLLSIPSVHDTAIIASPDGMIYLVESNSKKVLWSFTSGSSIYSSYQAVVNHDSDKENASGPSSEYFIECGDDWELYAHNKHFGKVKLSMTVEDFIRNTPLISENGAITLGSKKTTMFEVDAKTGRLINTLHGHGSDSLSSLMESRSMMPKNDELQLYITRVDYSLQSFASSPRRVIWNMTVAEIGVAFLCDDIDNTRIGAQLDSQSELGSEASNHFDMPLPCQSKASVYRFRTRNMLESFFRPGRLPEVHCGGVMDSMPAPNNILSSQPKIDKAVDFHHNGSEATHSLPLPNIKNAGNSDVRDMKIHFNNGSSMFTKGSNMLYIGVIILTVAVICRNHLWTREQDDLNEHLSNSNAKTLPSQRKKNRKSGKNNGSFEKKDKNVSSESHDGFAHIQSDNKPQWNLDRFDNGADGRRIGKLFVSNKEIAKGSNGTIVLEGIYEGRQVAVKRLVQAHHDVAFKEIQNLIASDRHPNIVRWYGVEYDQDFVYLSLERCTCSLDDFIQIYSDFSQSTVFTMEQASRSMIERKIWLDSVKDTMRDINLWKENGYPSPQLVQLMRDMVSGLAHLHELGIIHRDLKPQNVLIIKERSLCAKLSDMGISKRLHGDMSSLGHHATGCGSSGWQAPEQLLHGRQTRAVDLFSLGCVLFFCITGGRHPFGDRLERDVNIVKNQLDLSLVEHIPEAVDLFSQLLIPDPNLRPKALEVLHHPLFWSSEMRLSFLRETSDRVELEDRETNSHLLEALESIEPTALGSKWDKKMEPVFLANIGRYRRYNFYSVRDLLRIMRNKFNHYRELPLEIQEILGPVPQGFDGYFAIRFPKLLIEVYKVVYRYCREEECFQKYFKGLNSLGLL